MATCHNDLGHLHTAPAGLQTGDIGERSPWVFAPTKPPWAHPVQAAQSRAYYRGGSFEFLPTPGARPDLAPDSWRSGTRTRALQRGKRRGASSPGPQLRQRSGRARPPEGGAGHTGRVGAPGLPRRDVSERSSGRRGHPRPSRQWAGRPPPARRGAAWAGCGCSPGARRSPLLHAAASSWPAGPPGCAPGHAAAAPAR